MKKHYLLIIWDSRELTAPSFTIVPYFKQISAQYLWNKYGMAIGIATLPGPIVARLGFYPTQRDSTRHWVTRATSIVFKCTDQLPLVTGLVPEF